MPFEFLRPPVKAIHGVIVPVRVSMQARGETAMARMSVLIHKDTLEKAFGDPNTSDDTFNVGLGDKEDRHLLRIVAHKDGPFILRKSPGKASPYFGILLPPLDRFPNCKMVAQEVTFEIDAKKKMLVVTLPAWAWDPQIKKGREIAAEREDRKVPTPRKEAVE